MSISRRLALKQILIVAGGTMVLPACMQKDASTASIALKHLKVSGGQEQLLAELAETILPATQTPGAKDLYLHHFALKMVDDCSGPEDQKSFQDGLKSFEGYVTKRYDKPFAELTADQRTSLLQQLEAKKEVPEEVAGFYNKVKSLSIQGYLSSKHYLTQVQVYELVPGRYRGCVPLPEVQKTAAKTV